MYGNATVYNGQDAVQQVTAEKFISQGYTLIRYAFNILVPTGTPTSFKFPTLEVLRDKYIRYLTIFEIDYVTNVIGTSGNAAVIPTVDFFNGFVTLRNNDNVNLHYRIPFIQFSAQQVNLQPLYYVGDIQVSWDNCTVDFAAALTASVGNAIPFVAHYWNKCK